jgi:hypothetical protein
MERSEFDDDLRFCPTCRAYVRYLSSPSLAYCVECGGQVQIYSREDLAKLRQGTDRYPPVVDDLSEIL